MRWPHLLPLAVCAMLLGGQATGAAHERDDRLYTRLIVQMKDGTPLTARPRSVTPRPQDKIQALGAASTPAPDEAPVALDYLKTIHGNTHVAVARAPMSKARLQAIAAALAQDAQVDYAEVDEYMYPHATPNDPFYASNLWNLKPASAAVGGANFSNAWDRTHAGNPVDGHNVVIAVLDTGYRPHADVFGNIVGGYDFVSADNDRDGTPGWEADALDPGDWSTTDASCSTSSWHGTHVAGIAAAIGNNNYGVVGAAYGAKILPVRVLGICGGWSSDIQEGIYWAAGLHTAGGAANPNPAKVINLSLGSVAGVACTASYQTAVTAAINAGVTVVASSGNDGSSSDISSPANCTGVIAVTAHRSDGSRPGFANIGAGTALSAPGANVYSTYNSGSTTPAASPGGDSFLTMSGTSMAAPHVAAAAALLYQINPTITPALVSSLLTSTARAFPISSSCYNNSLCGSGMLDAFAAVKKLQLMSSGANTAPVLSPLAQLAATSAGTVQFTAVATDADSDPLSFTINTIPSGASFNNGTGAFVWSHPAPGSYSLTLQASDGLLSSNTQTVTINISAAPAPASGGGGGGGALEGWALWCLAALCVLRLLRPAPQQPQRDKRAA